MKAWYRRRFYKFYIYISSPSLKVDPLITSDLLPSESIRQETQPEIRLAFLTLQPFVENCLLRLWHCLHSFIWKGNRRQAFHAHWCIDKRMQGSHQRGDDIPRRSDAVQFEGCTEGKGKDCSVACPCSYNTLSVDEAFQTKLKPCRTPPRRRLCAHCSHSLVINKMKTWTTTFHWVHARITVKGLHYIVHTSFG